MTDHDTAEQAAVAEPIERITRYSTSCIPDSDINHRHFVLNIEYRGGGLWAVAWLDWGCLNARTDEWDYEMRPSEREDEWLADHRFDLDTARAHARRLAPTLTVNGWTVADVLARAAKETRS